jgi:hypothetical protein
MPSSLLVPLSLIYDPDLSPAAVHTWMQLRGLAGAAGSTPPLNLAETGAALGKSQSALYQHMALLRSKGALHWHSAGKGQVVFTFPSDDPPGEGSSCSQNTALYPPSLHHSAFPEFGNPERASLKDSFDSDSFDSDSIEAERGSEASFSDSGKPAARLALSPATPPAHPPPIPCAENPLSATPIPPILPSLSRKRGDSLRPQTAPAASPPSPSGRGAGGEGEPPQKGAVAEGGPPQRGAMAEGEPPQKGAVAEGGPPRRGAVAEGGPPRRGAVAEGELPNQASKASIASLYLTHTRLHLNRAQRELLAGQVLDLDRWRLTLEHWMAHRWSPRNVPGMLDLYTRGGPEFCHSCRPAAARPAEGAAGRSPAVPASLAVLEELKRESRK